MIEAVVWKDDHLEIIDQTALPKNKVILQLRTLPEIFEAIQKLRVRGAPLIGICAAYGLLLGMKAEHPQSPEDFFSLLQQKADHLATARPTAVNLFWALEKIKNELIEHQDQTCEALMRQLHKAAVDLHADDRQRCADIGRHGIELIPDSAGILTHCNTGALATGGIGTALGVIYAAHQAGKKLTVFADETRPLLQGARLTMWELMNAGIPATLLCDNMAGALMKEGRIDLVIVGSDRIAADGSVANKIGTYSVAILAKYHQIPFYVAAPLSTFDTAIHNGQQIPIEHRNHREVAIVNGMAPIAPDGSDCWNPAFDVTPPALVDAIVTEKGIIYPPYRENIEKML